MKKMLVLLMMVFAVVTVKAQLIVADDYYYVYVGVPGATTAIPRSSLPYGNTLTKGDFLPTKVAREASKQAAYEYGRTGSVLGTAEAMTEPVMATVGIIGQISAQVKAAKAAKRARKAERARAAQTTTTTRSTVQPVTTATTTTPVKVNKNVTYNVSRQRFESAEDLISGF
jgi:hypothetical protein